MRPNDFPSLQVTINWTLNELSRAGADRRSPFRWPVLTTSNGLQADARIIVLRAFSRRHRKALLYTDQRTPKISQLQQNPAASLLFFDPKRTIQIRATGTARVITEGTVYDEAWQHLSEASRRDYTTREAPGTPTVAPASTQADNSSDHQSHFAMIEINIYLIDWLLISREGHRRARFEWEAGELTQTWLTP